MPKPAFNYSSYLLRIWHVAEGETLSWRFYLEDLQTGKRMGFANHEILFAFLEAASAAATDSGQVTNEPSRDPKGFQNP